MQKIKRVSILNLMYFTIIMVANEKKTLVTQNQIHRKKTKIFAYMITNNLTENLSTRTKLPPDNLKIN